jgi:signal transduction histidine kinase
MSGKKKPGQSEKGTALHIYPSLLRWHPPYQKYRYFLYVGAILALCAIYFSTAKLGFSLAAVNGFATLVWLPSGISVAALLLFGYRLWPGITLGALLANFSNGAPLFVAIGIAIGNTLEALVIIYLLKRKGFSHDFDRLKDVLLLALLAIPLGSLVSATVGVSSLLLGKVIALSSYPVTWSTWWMGDMISILLLTPFLLTWSNWSHRNASLKQIAEMGALTMFTLAVGLVVFLGPLQPGQRSYTLTYLVFPPLIWAALRFGSRGTLSAILALSILAIVGTLRGLSPFSVNSPSESLLLLQSFMGIVAITSMILAAVTAERRAFEQRKDEFISMASHELKTPLTSLQGYTELLHMKFEQQGHQEAAHYLAKMMIQIDKLSRLIADLLDISKIQAGKVTFTEEDIDVDTLICEVVENMRYMTSRHQICIEGKVQRKIVGDREHLEQVLINLITNAIKYSPCPEQIIVRATSTHDTLTINVQDFGIGIPKAHQEKIFEQFYRIYGNKDRTYPGLGIGLYIAHQTIKRHGGKIWVKSVEKEGSTFSFSLPLASFSVHTTKQGSKDEEDTSS